MNDVNPADIQTEVFRLPSSCFAEENGSIANSGRWLQWHWAAAEPPGEALHDGKILAFVYAPASFISRKGANPAPLMNINWNYKTRTIRIRKRLPVKRTEWRWPIFMTTKADCQKRPAAQQLCPAS
jgi:anaerobic selenocysteine-containing dehydrogenase